MRGNQHIPSPRPLFQCRKLSAPQISCEALTFNATRMLEIMHRHKKCSLHRLKCQGEPQQLLNPSHPNRTTYAGMLAIHIKWRSQEIQEAIALRARLVWCAVLDHIRKVLTNKKSFASVSSPSVDVDRAQDIYRWDRVANKIQAFRKLISLFMSLEMHSNYYQLNSNYNTVILNVLPHSAMIL